MKSPSPRLSARTLVAMTLATLTLTAHAARAQEEDCLTASTFALIEAPTTVVYDTVVDVGRYPEWNPFIPRVEPPGIDIAQVGARFDLIVASPFDGTLIPTAERTNLARRPAQDGEVGLLRYAFRGDGFVQLGRPARAQVMIPVGENTLYTTSETFCGPAAGFAALFAQLGFDQQTEALVMEAQQRAG